MKSRSTGPLIVGMLAFVTIMLALIGPPGARRVQVAPSASEPPPSSIGFDGFTLVSSSIEFPAAESSLPAGPHVEVVIANCTSCHSAEMILSQPGLSSEQWTGIVEKMRTSYRAPVADENVPAILAYLTQMTSPFARPAGARH